MLASISIVAPTKEFPTVLLLHAVWSLIVDVPQMAIQRAFVRSRQIPLSGSFNVCLLGQLPKCSDLLVKIWNQVCAVRCKCRSHVSCEAELSNLPAGPLHLLNLLFTSCLDLGTMCRLSFIEHRVMMLECMPICGLSHVLHGEVSRDNSKILDVGQTHDSNDENAQWCFTRFSLQGTRGIQINGVMAICCSCSKRLSSDLLDLLTNRITQITCKCYTIRSLHRR